MHVAHELLRGELERLFGIEEMVRLSRELLGYEPEQLGGTESKGAFARALVTHCAADDALQALADAIRISSRNADERLRDLTQTANGELKPGTAVGSLEILRKLGEGGLGEVYLCRHSQRPGEEASDENERRIALKVIRAEHSRDRSAVHRLKTAWRAMQGVQTPGLAQVYGVGQLEDARPWVASEFVEGRSLARTVDLRGGLPFSEARQILDDVLEALEALHRRGLVHGDVKTENVFVVRTDDASRGVLVDGGAERLLSRPTLTVHRTGLLPLFGSAKAIAPEQAYGKQPDARSDLYAAGVLLYEALTGKPPFSGDSPIDIIAQHLSATAQPASEIRKDVPTQADEILAKALAKDPDARFQTARELQQALRALDTEGERAPGELDESVFHAARSELLERPENEAAAAHLETLAGEAGAWRRAAEAMAETAEAAEATPTRISLLLRAARIHATERKDATEAESLLRRVLELEPGHAVALGELETLKRSSGQPEDLVEVLLDRLEHEAIAETRAALLREVGDLYQELGEQENAFVAWLQALAEQPGDTRLQQDVERLATTPERWEEALQTLTQAAEQLQLALSAEASTAFDTIYPPQPTEPPSDEEIEEAEAALAQSGEAVESAEQELQARQEEAERLGEDVERAQQHADELQQRTEEARRLAEEAVRAYEELEGKAEQTEGDEELQAELQRAGEEAEARVDAADAAADEAHQAADEAADITGRLHAAQEAAAEALAQCNARIEEQERARQVVTQLRERQQDEGSERAEALAPEASSEEDALDEEVLDDVQEVQEDEVHDVPSATHSTAELTSLYVLMGRWYGDHLDRPDYALSCFGQALEVDPSSEEAFDAIVELYRRTQSWTELVGALTQRADATPNPVRERDYRAEAAQITAEQLGAVDEAEAQLRRVLEQDPAHPVAQETLEAILVEREDWTGLTNLLAQRASSVQGEARAHLFNRIGAIQEERLDDLEQAEASYTAALDVASDDLTALKGLERIHTRLGQHEHLLEVLSRQAELVATPKQRAALQERIGTLLDEELGDRAAAAEAFERVLQIDPAHEVGNTALARLYRHLQRFDDLVDTLERHARSTPDTERKVELLLELVRVLMIDVGAPERALSVCDRVLALDERQPEALELTARLKAQAGDKNSALAAIERLAEAEAEPTKQAELWIRAAKLLQEHGDNDGAMLRFRRALDADAASTEALASLRALHAARGDTRAVVDLLERELEVVEGRSRRGDLLAELGTLYLRELRRPERARELLTEALDLEPSNTVAAAGLGEIALQREEYEQAATHLEPLLSRIEDLEPRAAVEVCTAAAEALHGVGRTDEAVEALRGAQRLQPEDLALSLRLCELLESTDADAARRGYAEILERFDARLDTAGRADVLLCRARASLRAGDTADAVAAAEDAAQLRPESQEPFELLSDAYRAAERWEPLVETLEQRAQHASPAERFELLVDIGEILSERLEDRDGAVRTYVTALEMRPDARKVLAKLMTLYSDTRDWSRLVEVVLRIAELVDEPRQLAKYYNTAGTIAHQQLERHEEAAGYYEEALANDPELHAAFDAMVECLTQAQDWEGLVQAYMRQLERLEELSTPQQQAALLDACGEVLETKLERLGEAVEVYELAQQIEPDNRSRQQRLVDIYTSDPKRFFRKAVAAHRGLLQANSFRIESYQELRRIFTKMRHPDESWCLCQALRVLDASDPEEEQFFKKYRLTGLARAKQAIGEEAWRDWLVHPDQDAILTGIFAVLGPAIARAHARDLSTFGTDESLRSDPAQDPTTMSRMLQHAADTTQIGLPAVYHRPQDPSGLSFLYTAPPAIGIGEGARAGGPQQALAFVAGRHLSYFRSGHFLRQLVPTGSGLRSWLLAALKIATPKFPVPSNLQEQVREHYQVLDAQLTSPQRERLRSLSQHLLDSQPELDMRRWMAAVDLTADRVGFVLANDLRMAKAVIDASPEEAAAVPRKERFRQLLVYSVSDEYHRIRSHMGIALGS